MLKSIQCLITFTFALISVATLAAPGGISADLRIWLDANIGTTGTTAISQWNDQSANNKHLSQGNANNQPSLIPASPDMNFHQALRFDGNRDFLNNNTGILNSNSDDFSFFVITNINQSSGSENQLLAMGNSQNNPYIGFKNNGEISYSGRLLFVTDYWNFHASDLMPFNQPLIYSGAINYSLTSARAFNYINGRKNSDDPVNALNLSHRGSDNFVVGGDDQDLDGDISEVIVFRSVLNDQQRHRVESYLGIKYGLTLNHHYLSHTGSQIYTLDGQYDFGIVALAKAASSNLDQRISRAVNDSSGLILSTDLDFSSANLAHNDSLTDGDYLIMGHNNASTTGTQTSDLALQFERRTIREWKVENTQTSTAINLSFSTLPPLNPGENYALINNASGDFNNNNQVLRYSNTGIFPAVQFPLGSSYFTIAILSNKIEFSQSLISAEENQTNTLPKLDIFGFFPLDTPVPLNITGSATITSDYSPGNILIPAGSYDGLTANQLSINGLAIVNDTDPELDEDLIFNLDTSAIPGLNIGDANNDGRSINSSRYIIVDDDISTGLTGTEIIATDSSALADGLDLARVELQLKQTDGDNVLLAGVEVEFQISSGTAQFNNNLASFSTVTDSSGLARADIKSLTLGDVTISARIDRDIDGGTSPLEVISNGSPATVNFIIEPASPSHSTISANPLIVSTDGAASSTLTIQARDNTGANLTTPAGNVIITSDSSNANIGTISYLGNGAYSSVISNKTAENVQVSVSLDGIVITSGDPVIQFIPGLALASNSTLTSSDSTLRANGLDNAIITIQAIDGQGNVLTQGGDAVEIFASNNAQVSQVTDHNNGSYSANIQHNEIASIQITGRINSQDIATEININFVDYGNAQLNPSDGLFVNGFAPLESQISISNQANNEICNTLADAESGYFHCFILSPLTQGEILTINVQDLAGNVQSNTLTINNQDSDGDSISDIIESLAATQLAQANRDTRLSSDSDQDGIPDYAEIILGSDVLSTNSPVLNGQLDNDLDGITNAQEHYFLTLAGSLNTQFSSDSDGDGLPDITELTTAHGKFYHADFPTQNGAADDDDDSISNAIEAYLLQRQFQQASFDSDYDGDGYSDVLEVQLASNPLAANEKDSDYDGINDHIEAFLTGTINDASNTALNDRDGDQLADIYELKTTADLFNLTSALNSSNNGDQDNDGLSDAIEHYLYDDAISASESSDLDGDGIADTVELSSGSNPFIHSSPSLWFELEKHDETSLTIQLLNSGFQAPQVELAWDTQDILGKTADAEVTFPSPRSIYISGLTNQNYRLTVNAVRHFSASELSSELDIQFNLSRLSGQDRDQDGINDAHDLHPGELGFEEQIQSHLGLANSYIMSSQYRHKLTLGEVARLAGNQATHLNLTQITEAASTGQIITQLSGYEAVENKSNIFDFTIANLEQINDSSKLVIPLHQALPDNPSLLIFSPHLSSWRFFQANAENQYQSALGEAGLCPEVNSSEYQMGLTSGHHCLQITVADGGLNDNDQNSNGSVSQLIAIGSASQLAQGANEIINPADSIQEQLLTSPETVEKDNVSEASSSGGAMRPVILLLFFLISVLGQQHVRAAPINGQINFGTGSIDADANHTQVTQQSERLAIDWQEFNLDENESISFIQPSSSAIVLNRDMSGNASNILGNINANGQVFILNSAGILIGENASIQASSFLASDLEMNIEDFAEDEIHLSDLQPNSGGITNLGRISTHGQNGIFIAGQFIRNTGQLISSNADIHTLAADQVILSLADGQLAVQLTQAIEADISNDGNLIYNEGDILALNGNIYIDLFYSDAIKANTVNNQGIIQAVAISEDNGQVFLTAQSKSSANNDNSLNNLVADALPDETAVNTLDIPLLDKPKVSMNSIMPDCANDSASVSNTKNDSGTDCSKYLAIKRYLGRLLLGGELPQ